MIDLKNKIFLVTGSTSGIGEGIAIHLAGLGAKLTLTGRDETNLKRVAGLCISAGLDDHKILCIAGDICLKTVRESLISRTMEKFGSLDVLVNNAGLTHFGDSTTTTEEHYDEILNVNLKSVFFLTKLAIPHLKNSKGNIINISSIAGSSPTMGNITYNMSKAALDMYTKCLSLELASSGVRVNAISPGLVPSRLLRRNDSPFVEEEPFQNIVKQLDKRIPMGKHGQPSDIARAVAFLSSNIQASFITGENMVIDGAHRFQLN